MSTTTASASPCTFSFAVFHSSANSYEALRIHWPNFIPSPFASKQSNSIDFEFNQDNKIRFEIRSLGRINLFSSLLISCFIYLGLCNRSQLSFSPDIFHVRFSFIPHIVSLFQLSPFHYLFFTFFVLGRGVISKFFVK